MREYTYRTKGTCSQQITIQLEGDIIVGVSFLGGCNGNLKGINALVKGMQIDEVINRLSGIQCGFRPTSCPDQLATALKEIKSRL